MTGEYRRGLLFDNHKIIAKFRSFTNEDWQGIRWLGDFSIDIDGVYRIREKMHPIASPSLLRAVYVEYNPKAGSGAPGKLIKDFGFQYIRSIIVQYKSREPKLDVQLSVVRKRTPDEQYHSTIIMLQQEFRARHENYIR